jgi:isocitrate/isopropylmalate dehydrogenase
MALVPGIRKTLGLNQRIRPARGIAPVQPQTAITVPLLIPIRENLPNNLVKARGKVIHPKMEPVMAMVTVTGMATETATNRK